MLAKQPETAKLRLFKQLEVAEVLRDPIEPMLALFYDIF